MKPILRLIFGGVLLGRLVAQPEVFGERRRSSACRRKAQSGTGRAAAVRVADSARVFTGQVVAPGLGGDARTEAAAARDVLGTVLARPASATESVVRRSV